MAHKNRIKFKAKCQRPWIIDSAAFTPVVDSPAFQLTDDEAAEGIEKILHNGFVRTDGNPCGVFKVTLPSAITNNLHFGQIQADMSVNSPPLNTIECRHADGIYQLAESTLENATLFIDKNLVMKDMHRNDMSKVKCFTRVTFKASLTEALASASAIPENLNFKKLDNVFQKQALMIMEHTGTLKALAPETGDIPTAYLSVADGTKIWYSIKEGDQFKVVEKLKSLKLATCITPLEHENMIFTKEFFAAIGVTLYKTVQKRGDIVVVKPGTFFQTLSLNPNICEKISFYAHGFAERAIRHLICNCKDRCLTATDEDVVQEATLVAALLQKVQRTLYGAPGESYAAGPLETSNNTSTSASETLSPITEEERRRRAETPAPRSVPQTSQEDLHQNFKKNKDRQKKYEKRAARRNEDAEGGAPSTKKRKTVVDPRAAALRKIANQREIPHPPGCWCIGCALKANNANDGRVEEASAETEEQVEESAEDGVDANEAENLDLTPPPPAAPKPVFMNAPSLALKLLNTVANPHKTVKVLSKRIEFHQKHVENRSIEVSRWYERTRVAPKVHSGPLITWFTNTISRTGQQIEKYEEQRHEAFEEGKTIGRLEKNLPVLYKKKEDLRQLRIAYRILKQIFCLDRSALNDLISNGYSVMGIFRDYVNPNGVHGEIYELAVTNALKTFDKEAAPSWIQLRRCKKLWSQKFGFDNRYSIPWQKWQEEMQNIQNDTDDEDCDEAPEPIDIPANFSVLSQDDCTFIELADKTPCQCDTCAHVVECDCAVCTEKRRSVSCDVFRGGKSQAANTRKATSQPHAAPKTKNPQKSSSNSQPAEVAETETQINSRMVFVPNFSYDETALPPFATKRLEKIRDIQAQSGFRFTPPLADVSNQMFNGVSQFNLDQLGTTNWIGNIILDYYVDLIQADERNPQAILLHSTFGEIEDISPTEIQFITNLLDSRRWLLVPMIDGQHWRLFVLDINDKSYYIYDPKKSRIKAIEPESLKEKIQRILSKICSCYLRLNVSTQYCANRIPQPHLPIQPNNYDCGIFVLQVARQLNHGVDAVQIRVAVPFSRELILSELLQKSLLM